MKSEMRIAVNLVPTGETNFSILGNDDSDSDHNPDSDGSEGSERSDSHK
jgi:hypothetical protein